MRAIAAIAKPTTRIEHLALLEAQMAHLPAAERMRTIGERLEISRATYYRLRKKARAVSPRETGSGVQSAPSQKT
jgi:hypothetical protein